MWLADPHKMDSDRRAFRKPLPLQGFGDTGADDRGAYTDKTAAIRVVTGTVQSALERCERHTESDEMLSVPRVWVAATESLLFVAAGLSCKATSGAQLSPTVFRDGEFRFFFFSREESRVHIHVSHPDGEAKF
jgi:hypothetical protein